MARWDKKISKLILKNENSQFPCSFELTEKLLVLLADHSLASSFGTFLCDRYRTLPVLCTVYCSVQNTVLDCVDSEAERLESAVPGSCVSLWTWLNQVTSPNLLDMNMDIECCVQVEVLEQYLSPVYLPNPGVLWPSVAPMSLQLWEPFFLRWLLPQGVGPAYHRAVDIVEQNRTAQAEAGRLRPQLLSLMEEAVQLGVLQPEEAGEDEKEVLQVEGESMDKDKLCY